MKKFGSVAGSMLAWAMLLASAIGLHRQIGIALEAWFGLYPSMDILLDARVSYAFLGIFGAILAVVIGIFARPRYFWIGTFLFGVIYSFIESIGLRPIYREKYNFQNTVDWIFFIAFLVLFFGSSIFFYMQDKHSRNIKPLSNAG
jgi:hypothetical protein